MRRSITYDSRHALLRDTRRQQKEEYFREG